MQSDGGDTTKRWKSGSNDWREGPAFLDATSSVSASTFGARRLPELKNLYFETRLENNDDHIIHERKNLLSGGGKRSSRHLRRRTTAIHSKRRHRYPSPNKSPEYKGLTRKSKRKKSHHLESEHLQWLSPKNTSESVSIDEEDGHDQSSTNRMWQVTHRWHAKRFHLLSSTTSQKEQSDSVRGGWTGIPLVHSNRGPRATIRLSQNKDKTSELSSVMVRDVTWEEQPLVLKLIRSNQNKSSKPKEEAQFLLRQLGKLCPGIMQPARGGEALSDFFLGKRSIQETLYGPDSFPSGAIGPACLRMVPRKGELGAEIRCHPSIRPRIRKAVQQIASSIPSSSSLRLKLETISEHIPRICFRLYGSASLQALNKVLTLFEGNEPEFLEQHEMRESSSGALPNGSIIRVNGVNISNEATGTVTDDVFLIYRAPRPLDCPANCAMAGWEIHCTNPTFAKAVWLSLVTLDGTTPLSTSTASNQNIRGCCAIGLIDDCHMRLECEPPIPVFPRDYVDTEDSQKYWRSSSDSCSWKRIRQLCEGGWGRLPTDKEKRLDKLENIDFGKFVALDESENESEENIVVVRGAFGQPFVDAIGASCGSYTSNKDQSSSTEEATTKKRRRNRRPSCCKNKLVVAPPLSEASKVSLGDYCTNLSSSLTLPAALLVHVRIIGQGTIAPGMVILGAGTEDLMLGKITAGGFSSSRGVCHGIGMVGAVRLLDYLARTTRNEDRSEVSYGRVVRLANGSQSRQLLVRVATMKKEGGFEKSGYSASLEALI